jgi:hypothetical protein
VSSHYSEDELTLYYYGEGRYSAHRERARRDLSRHLRMCAACAALYHDISSTLAMVVADDVPARGDQYGLEVWQRIRHRLPERRSRFEGFRELGRFAGFGAGFSRVFAWDRAALAVAAVLLVVAAFIAGRTWQSPTATPAAGNPPSQGASTNAATPANAASPANPSGPDSARRRILLASVADHLDRSERVLTEIMNSGEPSDISAEQQWAEDLITTSRLYRQDALDAGEQSVATVLDDLERTLLEIVHSPSKIGAADLEQIRRRVDAAALLFKVRVMSEELRQREAAPAGRPVPRSSTSIVS